jgi:LacI family transcriptional regulator
MNLFVPADVSVTGFNSDTAERSHVPVTSVGYSKIEYGELAIHHLYERIMNPAMPYRRIALVPKLLLKSSAGPVKTT